MQGSLGEGKLRAVSMWVDDKDLGISIQKPGKDKVMDALVIKGMDGEGNQGLESRLVVAPMAVGKAVLYLNISTNFCLFPVLFVHNYFRFCCLISLSS